MCVCKFLQNTLKKYYFSLIELTATHYKYHDILVKYQQFILNKRNAFKNNGSGSFIILRIDEISTISFKTYLNLDSQLGQ